MTLFRSPTALPRLSPLSATKSSNVAVLDIGTHKICCMIAQLKPRDPSECLPGRSHTIRVLGLGHQRSRGIKSGVIVDMSEAETAIRLAVDGAETTAGMSVDSLVVNVSAGRLSSETYSSDIDLGGREVALSDIGAVLAAGYEHTREEGRATVHALPIGYTLDAEQGITAPQSMVGSKLAVDMHMVSADAAPLRNLELCINRAHLVVDGMVATPYASGLAALVEDEARMGAACIDMGAGTTSVSLFFEGHLVFADAITVGGNHVTMDIARGLSIRVVDAERLKVLHGRAVATQADEREMLTAPSLEEGNASQVQVSVAQLSQIIRPRVEETFELLRDRIQRSGFAKAMGRRIVLTGGASQLGGATDVATQILGANVRMGRPMGISGLPKTAKGPAFSAAAGLMIYPQMAQSEFVSGLPRTTHRSRPVGGALGRVGRWLKESF